MTETITISGCEIGSSYPVYIIAEPAASRVFHCSLFGVIEVKAINMVTNKNVRSIHVGHRPPPLNLPEVLGRRVSHGLARGTPLSWDLVS
jgi:sialic acid synthase SpsE